MTMRADPSDRHKVDKLVDGFDLLAVISLVALGIFALCKSFQLI